MLLGFGVYSKNFLLPLMIKTMGYGDQAAGYLTALPGVSGVAGMLVFPIRATARQWWEGNAGPARISFCLSG